MASPAPEPGEKYKSGTRWEVKAHCPVCPDQPLQDTLLQHFKTRHKGYHFSTATIQACHRELVACPCGAPTWTTGLKQHQTKSQCQRPAGSAAHSQGPTPAQQQQSLGSQQTQEQMQEDALRRDEPMMERYKKLAKLPTVYKPLPARTAKAFKETVYRLAGDYSAEPTAERLLDIFGVVKVGLAPTIRQKNPHGASARLRSYPHVSWPEPAARSSTEPADIPTKVQKQVEEGQLHSAARTLAEDASLADATPEVFEELERLHPPGRQNPFGNIEGANPPAEPDDDQVLQAFATFRLDTAGGISGWTKRLLAHVMEPDKPFMKFIKLLTVQIAQGSAPCREILTASRLTALKKPGGGVRPIAVGELVYRLCAKIILPSGISGDALLPEQFGVGKTGGVEPVVRLVERAWRRDLPREYRHLYSVDLSNAFNRIDRSEMAQAVRAHAPQLFRMAKWAYNKPSALLYVNNDTVEQLSSSQGVRQGDPLGPLLFSVTFRNTLEELKDHLGPTALLAAYLDDTYILSESSVSEKVKDFFRQRREVGFDLNERKSKEYDLQEQDFELELLGSYVGPNTERFITEQIQQELEVIGRLEQVGAQATLLLIRSCLQGRLRHLIRSLPLSEEALSLWEGYDRHLQLAVLRLRGQRTSHLQFDKQILSLPVRLGGLGLLSLANCAPHARRVMLSISDEAIQLFLPAGILEEDQHESPVFVSQRELCRGMFADQHRHLLTQLQDDQARLFADNSSKIGSQWLSAIPCKPYFKMTAAEVAVGLTVRTLTTGNAVVCPKCGQSNFLGHDEVCVKRNNNRTRRHEFLKGALAFCLRQVEGTEVLVEPHTQQLADGRNGRTDLRITGPASFQQETTEYDVSIATSLTKEAAALSARGASVMTTSRFELAKASVLDFLDKKAQRKIAKYQGRTECAFHPILISLGGTLARQTTPIFDHWKAEMSKELWKELMFSISVSLLRARARYFIL